MIKKKKKTVTDHSESRTVDCVSFKNGKGGKPTCSALKDVYCLKEPHKRCSFQRQRVTGLSGT